MATINAAGNTNQKGKTAQYQIDGIVTGGSVHPAGALPALASSTVIGTVPPGKPGITQISTVIQRSTDPLVSGQDATNQADNFVANTAAVGQAIPTVNAAFTAAAGKSLAPEHE
jgi:hypothetical protein